MSKNKETHSPLLLLLPFLLVAVILQIASLPPFIDENRPDFAAIVMIFFATIVGSNICLELAWLTGFVIDLLIGAPLGINALTLCAQVYLISSQFSAFSKYKLWQQALTISLCSLIVRIGGYWLAHVIMQTNYETNFLMPSLLMGLLWLPLCPLFNFFVSNISGTISNDPEKK